MNNRCGDRLLMPSQRRSLSRCAGDLSGTLKNEKTNPILPLIFHSLLQLFTRQLWTFPQKTQKMNAFCNFLKQTYLTPCTTKTYINIPIHSSTHLPIHKIMQNKANFESTHSSTTSPDGSRATSHESRLKMQNKPNLHKSSHKCLCNTDLQKYLHPALLVSTNNQSSIIDNQLRGPISPHSKSNRQSQFEK